MPRSTRWYASSEALPSKTQLAAARPAAALDVFEPPSVGPNAGYTEDDFARDRGIDPRDRAVSPYADAFTGSFWQETERAAREQAG